MLIKYYRYFVSQVCVHYDTISLHSQQSPIIARQKLCADTDTWQQHGGQAGKGKTQLVIPLDCGDGQDGAGRSFSPKLFDKIVIVSQ